MVTARPIDLPPTLVGVTGPLVSVVLATYNPDETIRQSIQSVVEQTYASIQLVIVDGSYEETLAVLDEEHEWIKHVTQEGSGVAAAWNEGIAAADGEIVSFLADDDYYAPEKTELQVTRLQEGCDVVYSDEYVITQDDEMSVVQGLAVEDPETHYITYFRTGQGVPHLTVAGRKQCFEEIKFDESLEAREDPHLWVRLFREYTPCYIDRPLAYKRRRADSLTSDFEMMFRNELAEIKDLVSLFPELQRHVDRRRNWAKYRYCRKLIDAGQDREALRLSAEILRDEPTHLNAFALLVAASLPYDSRKVVEQLERVKYKMAKIRTQLRSLGHVE